MHVGGANDFIRDHSNALHDILRELGTFDGVTLSVFEEEVGLEEDEVGLMGSHILLELLCIVLA